MGLGIVYLASRFDDRLTLLLMTGVLAGFRTFSAFSLDAFSLYLAGRARFALGYVGISAVGPLAAVLLAVQIMRLVTS